MNSVNTNATMQKVDPNNTYNQTEAKMGSRKVESYKSDKPLKLIIAEYNDLVKKILEHQIMFCSMTTSKY